MRRSARGRPGRRGARRPASSPRPRRRTAAARSSRRRPGTRRARRASGRLRAPVSGWRLVTMQRPTLPRTSTSASPMRTRRPIQASSSCGPTPSTPKSIRKRRGRRAPRSRRPRASPRASRWRGCVTPPPAAVDARAGLDRLDEAERPADERRRARPTRARRPAAPRPRGAVEAGRHGVAELDLALERRCRRGSASASVPVSSSQSALIWTSGAELLAVQQPAVLADQVEAPVLAHAERLEPHRRRAAASASPFTGATEIQATVAAMSQVLQAWIESQRLSESRERTVSMQLKIRRSSPEAQPQEARALIAAGAIGARRRRRAPPAASPGTTRTEAEPLTLGSFGRVPGTVPGTRPKRTIRFRAVRLIVARCEVRYTGRLTARPARVDAAPDLQVGRLGARPRRRGRLQAAELDDAADRDRGGRTAGSSSASARARPRTASRSGSSRC